METQEIRQTPSRPCGLAVPRSHWQRGTCGGKGFQERPREHGQADAALHRGCCPRPGHFHSTGTLGDIEVCLDRPAMPIGGANLQGGQLPGCRADQQRTTIGRIIYAHDIQEGAMGRRKGQIAPAAEADALR